MVAERLGTDIRYVNPPYIGPPLPTFDDGSIDEPLGHPPPADAQRVRRVRRAGRLALRRVDNGRRGRGVPWPNPDWFDYDAIPALCEQYPDLAIAAGDFGVQDFINGVAFGRGVEQVLMDIAAEDPVYLYIVEKRHRFYMRLHRADAGGRRAGGSTWCSAATISAASAAR